MNIPFLLFIFISILVFSSSNSCTSSTQVPNTTYDSKLDSTYHPRKVKQIKYERIQRGETLDLPALNEWKNVIRLRKESGWGTFDYVCSIYNDHNRRIQLIRQKPSIFGKTLTFSIQEKRLSVESYDSIVTLLENREIYEVPFDLEPNNVTFDGDEYTLAIKQGEFFKAIYWQNENRIETAEKEKVIRTFKEILMMANYPIPNAKIYFGRKVIQDSIYCKVALDDYEIARDYYALYKGNTVIKKQGIPEFKLHINDTLAALKNLDVYIKLWNNEVIKVQKSSFNE